MAAGAGLLVGILGVTLVLIPQKKEKTDSSCLIFLHSSLARETYSGIRGCSRQIFLERMSLASSNLDFCR